MSIFVTFQLSNNKIAKKNVGLFCVADFTPLSETRTNGVKHKDIRNVSIRIGRDFTTERIEFEIDDYLAQIRFPDGNSYSEVVHVAPQKHPVKRIGSEITLFIEIGQAEASDSAVSNDVVFSRARRFTTDSELKESKVGVDEFYIREESFREALKPSRQTTGAPFRAFEQRINVDRKELLNSLSSQLDIEPITRLYLGNLSTPTDLIPASSNSSRVRIQLAKDNSNFLPQWDGTSQFSNHQYFVYSSLENSGNETTLLANIPSHWYVISSGKSVPVKIDVQRKYRKRRATTLKVIIPDPEIQSVILFSQLTDLSAALSILDKSVEYLRGKVVNPYAAAAAGYVLVMSPINDSDAPWEDWIGNLSNFYSDFPDGNILHATLLLQRYSRNKQIYYGDNPYYPPSVKERYRLAIKLVLDAVSKGLPIYRQGLNLLSSNIKILLDDAELSNNDKNSLTKAAKLINWMRMRVDPNQAFTVLDISNTVLQKYGR